MSDHSHKKPRDKGREHIPEEASHRTNLLYRRTAPQAFQHPFHARAISAAANRIRRRLPAPQTADTKVAGNYQPSKPKSSRFSAPVRVPAPTGALVFHVSISRHSPALLPSCRDRVFRGRMVVVLRNSILPEGNPSGLPHARRCASRMKRPWGTLANAVISEQKKPGKSPRLPASFCRLLPA